MRLRGTAEKARGSACGKAILVGEHFVVWGGTALAIPVRSSRLTVSLVASADSRSRFALPTGSDDQLAKACRECSRVLRRPGPAAVTVSVRSNFPHSAGLGSSAAFSVAFVRAWLSLSGKPPDEDVVAQTALEMERVFHEHASGIDSTTIAFETPCYVKTGDRFVVDTPREQEGPRAGFIDVASGGAFVLADSGGRRATGAVVRQIAAFARQPKGDTVLARFTGVAEAIALQTANALRKGDFEYVGLMLNENHYLLSAMGLSTPGLDMLRGQALAHGAFGCKLTGAGMGGFVLAVTTAERADGLAVALRKAGARRVLVERT
jgi:mevalonate kinase